MSDAPAWKDDFPVSWVDDHYVTRREFTKSLVLVSGAACAANGAVLALGAAERAQEGKPLPEVRVAARRDLPVGGALRFDYPEAGRPCLLLRLDEERFAAFGQKCTHLGCPVLYRPQEQVLHCPCHEGFFKAADGTVLSGPPPRPLPQVKIEVRGDEVWATGLVRR